MSPAQSPYERALGDAAFGHGGLHPRLRAYFSAIPDGMRGVGHGTFDTVGTPRRWLRPVLRAFIDDDVVFPIWERDVPFTVVNVSSVEAGQPAVVGERTFHFESGDRVMRDLISVTALGLVDTLGSRRRLRAAFHARVVEGALLLQSTRVEVRLWGRYVRVPRMLAPRVELEERFCDSDDRQHVSVLLSVPLIGRVYEYSGSFRYKLNTTRHD
ncbi:MAG: DUF4166 domain-containing protein [Cryobacterium sp.]|nr:DUF4166 domain-containing protein [Cryobacterium sp.]